jgi:hypothetical protein
MNLTIPLPPRVYQALELQADRAGVPMTEAAARIIAGGVSAELAHLDAEDHLRRVRAL